MEMLIRGELPTDADAIDRLTVEAFKPMPYSSGTEARIIRELRASGDLTMSLVAIDDHDHDILIGHVAFSPVTIDDRHDGWFGLGPISVRIDRQRQGIGRTLVAEGLRRLKDTGSSGVALIGDPRVYASMGFVSDGRLSYPGVDARIVQYQVLNGAAPRGRLRFSAPFEDERLD